MLPARALNEIDLYKFAKSIPNFRGVAYYKKGIQIEYFDSYGNLQPPREIINYLGKNIKYNYNRYQKNNSIICGQLCLKFLFEKYIYK
jgi:hypothetical protein